MATDAQGRQLSEDGYYYWDGANWQPVDPNAASGGGGSASSQQSQSSSQQSQSSGTDAQGRQLSPDGNYYWDGSNWQSVGVGGASATGTNGSGGSAQSAFAQAMSQAGYHIDANAIPDLSTLQSGISSALQWYQSLDHTLQAGIDAATKDPGEASIALSHAGVASGIDSLLQAFDQLQGSLGELLQAAQQALQTAQQGAGQSAN